MRQTGPNPKGTEDSTMRYLDVLKRDNHRCRLRGAVCAGQATSTVLDIPAFLGGGDTENNTISVCRPCRIALEDQRGRAAELFGVA